MTFSGILSVVELLCIPEEIMSTTLPVSFDPTITMTCCYFCGAELHLYRSNNCTEGTELLEDIVFRGIGMNKKDKGTLCGRKSHHFLSTRKM